MLDLSENHLVIIRLRKRRRIGRPDRVNDVAAASGVDPDVDIGWICIIIGHAELMRECGEWNLDLGF